MLHQFGHEVVEATRGWRIIFVHVANNFIYFNLITSKVWLIFLLSQICKQHIVTQETGFFQISGLILEGDGDAWAI